MDCLKIRQVYVKLIKARTDFLALRGESWTKETKDEGLLKKDRLGQAILGIRDLLKEMQNELITAHGKTMRKYEYNALMGIVRKATEKLPGRNNRDARRRLEVSIFTNVSTSAAGNVIRFSLIKMQSLPVELYVLKDLEYLSLRFFENAEILDLSHFKKLKQLDVDNSNITALKSLENCRDLQSLFINYSGVRELPGIEKLEKLSVLYATGSALSSLQGLEKLSALTQLHVEGCPIPTSVPEERAIIDEFERRYAAGTVDFRI